MPGKMAKKVQLRIQSEDDEAVNEEVKANSNMIVQSELSNGEDEQRPDQLHRFTIYNTKSFKYDPNIQSPIL